MLIELIKKTVALSGNQYYYVNANGCMQHETWTDDPQKAKEYLLRVAEMAKKYPVDVIETIETIDA